MDAVDLAIGYGERTDNENGRFETAEQFTTNTDVDNTVQSTDLMEVYRLRLDIMNNRLCPGQQGKRCQGEAFGFLRQATLADQRLDLRKPAMLVLMRQVDSCRPSTDTPQRSPDKSQYSSKIRQERGQKYVELLDVDLGEPHHPCQKHVSRQAGMTAYGNDSSLALSPVGWSMLATPVKREARSTDNLAASPSFPAHPPFTTRAAAQAAP